MAVEVGIIAAIASAVVAIAILTAKITVKGICYEPRRWRRIFESAI